ncbi:flagellar type III secretion system protein FlhB [Cereibacter azotoformans]|uniref:flagellar type III secretion system protein FlhB n=1 Tax=Cereibacter azotoformans TaxID=43057 RepID=UPI003B21F7AB
MSEGDEDKPHEPSQRKLEEARRKGELPKSQDLVTAASYGGLLLAALSVGQGAIQRMGDMGTSLLGQADRFSTLLSDKAQPQVGGLVVSVLLAVLPFFAIPALAAVAALVAQRALVVAPTKLAPKTERISPVSGFRNRFGRNGLFEFAKSLVKLLLVAVVFALFVTFHMAGMLDMLAMAPGLAVGRMFMLMLEFLAIVVLLSGGIGLIDYFWQRADHLRRHRMSRKELTDEAKDAEGDPHVKAQRRQKAMEIATNRMLQDVAGADVVVVNPTHYAVALRWKRGDRRAPLCVAKGTDEIAARIRERAAEAGVPIHRDPPTARALHAAVRVGEEIRPEHYKAVAAAIRFSERIRRRMKGVRA